MTVWTSLEHRDSGPAFQELHRQEDSQAGTVLFLHGACNAAQWSMSVHREGTALLFDVAARVTRPPLERTVQYALSGDDATRIVLQPRDASTGIAIAAATATLSPAIDADLRLPATLQWKYAVALRTDAT